ncbi:MAG: VTT domain-containing protein [Proteobacteria bacterium]|jgi:membrane protein DedA with SNARE-associated domain/rhodanese-related sulfurtransferase|nr:VTT domain-containing protein [Pseudomonadota bacterium]
MDPSASALLHYGAPLVGLNVFLQQIGLPIPAVPTMIVAGALSTSGRFDLGLAFAAAVAASLVADLAWFWAGRRHGYRVLRLLCRISLSPDTCVRQTEGIFERWGFYSVLVSKFIPGFSTVAPPIAGALRMKTSAFVVASLGSAALWAGAAMAVGALFAREVDALFAWMAANIALGTLVLSLLVALYVVVKAFERWRMTRFVVAAMISVDELRAALAGTSPPLVIDVGTRLAQSARPHIPGALPLDLDAIARRTDLPRDRDIVLYCACPNEVSARRAAAILLRRGLRRARPLAGGIDAWVARGFPVEPGTPIEVRVPIPKVAARR